MTSKSFGQLDPLLIAPSTSTKTNPEEVDSRYIIKGKPSTPVAIATPQPVSPVPVTPEKKPSAPKIIKAQEERSVPTFAPLPNKDFYADIPNDITKNLLEVKTESFVIYNGSKSNYKYRNFSTFSQGVGLAVDVWINRDIGIETVYKTTINSTMNGLDHATQLKFTERWFDFAMQLRSEFESSNSPFFVTKFGYSNYQKKMPVDNMDRATLDTTGPRLEIETYFPTSNTHIWNLTLDVRPFQTHKEKAVGANLASGDSGKTWIWGIGLGSRTIFSRKYQFNWGLNYYLEKTVFSGTTKQIDPWTGNTLTDVSVTNSFLFFNLGFIWGG